MVTMSPPSPASRAVSAIAWHTPEIALIVFSLLLAWTLTSWMLLVSIPAIVVLVAEPIVWRIRFRKHPAVEQRRRVALAAAEEEAA